MRRQKLIAALVAGVALPGNFAAAEPDAGAYLAARQAGTMNDFASGARFFTKGLIADPSNLFLLDNAVTSFLALGQVDRAYPVARAIVDNGLESQVANLVLNAHAAKNEDWDYVFTALEAGQSVGPLADGLSQGWAHLGQGDIDKALASFDQVVEAEGLAVYGLTHKAYALASVGDFEAAEAVFATAGPEVMKYSRRSGIARAQILSQLGQNEGALKLLDELFGRQLDPSLATLRADLEADVAVPYTAITTPAQGIAEIYHSIAGALRGDAPDAFTLLYARATNYLFPENTDSILSTAGLLEELGQYDLANDTYAMVDRDDPAYHAAEMGRADVLSTAGRRDAAVEVLDALARNYPDLPDVYASKGDTLRQMEKYPEAERSYSRALDLYADESPKRWFVHYTRGITRHQLNEWPGAEADFRAALSLNPDQPQILNYLGYSLVERGEKLDEALGMIEKAAASVPDNGAIIDSLGWVLFQLDRYDEAVGHMERAASLEPVDPVINDHLGDVYWAVGRQTEAHFQWHRALSFDPKPEDATRIRAKIERGLDAVLHEEGEDPIHMARQGDN